MDSPVPRAGDAVLRPGVWRENLSTDGMTEYNVLIGDIYRRGEALIRVTSRASHALNLISTLPSATWPSYAEQSGKTGWLYRVIAP